MSGATHFYVWYTLTEPPAGAARVVADLLAAVEDETGVAGRILARRDDPTTWMEIYENIADAAAFERALAALVKRHGVARICGGARHVERFGALTDILRDVG